MFPLWDVAIAPILEAADAKRVVEIGALRGETTTLVIDHLGEDAQLHVIDPAPEFDPADWEDRFRGRCTFHRDTSHNVLPNLGSMDVALIDGDHNWFTVYNEMKMLAATARRTGEPLPIMILHDVGWPYGRRDLYYAPERIPKEFRQAYRQAGMRPGRSQLLAKGGLNPTMYNAVQEGGERNGVMTAVDDFIAEHDQPVRLLVIPIYFGLAIVVECERLERQPRLAAALDRLETSEGRHDLLKVSEDVRIQAMLFQHNSYFSRNEKAERATKRYLHTVQAALLNEHYLENELRLEYLAQCAKDRRSPDPILLRDPVRNDQEKFRQLRRERVSTAGPGPAAATSFLPYAAMGRTSLEHLERCLDAVRETHVPGDLVECGTGRGGGAIFMRAYLDAYEISGPLVWVVDRFRASPEPDRLPELGPRGVAGFRADLNLVRDGFARFGLLDDTVRFLQGPVGALVADAPVERIALLRIGRGLGTETRDVLEHLYDKVSPDGFVVIEDHQDPECRKEVDAFRTQRGITATLEHVDASTVVWRKGANGARRAPARTEVVRGAPHPPLAPRAPTTALDLSVVIVMYNMRREAERTLFALSRAYQEGMEDKTYEVIVLENGSAEHQKLGDELVASFGPEFRYVDLGDEAEPSPVAALNHGIRLARGNAIALMIDGAHVVTPGVLRYGLAGLSTYAPAIVATQQWYVGPGQQSEAMDDGYDQAYEDRLFEKIQWPSAGYRLFEIGHFIGDRDWFDGVWESNCIFVSRTQLEQVGCFDENFDMAGGGYANLELYERLGSSPDIAVATIIGEGSFHQMHGGTTTNQPDASHRRMRIHGYSEHYSDLRGRRFRGPGKPIHYVGSFANPAARRSKPRRMSTKTFAAAQAFDPDGRPEQSTPVPQELTWEFTESVWRSLPWERTTWLGHRIATAPTDLLAYQELIATARPDWIVETGTGDGGRALFLASICDLVGHGEVISIDAAHVDDLPRHPRLRYVTGVAHAEATVAEVCDIVGDTPALVVLGSCTDRPRTIAEFQAYARLVPIGSHVVVADTIVNGHPVWTGFGPGPAEAVKQILNTGGEFAPDPTMEKYSLTFNPGGFLKRVR
jgi:cephalosporin hydroxylase